METRLPVTALQAGLFISELDRPWLDTPFLLEGFLLETPEHLSQLQEYCKFVTVNLDRSVGGKERWAYLSDQKFNSEPLVPHIQYQTIEIKEQITLLKELRQRFALWSQGKNSKADTAWVEPKIIIYADSTPIKREIPHAQAVHRLASDVIEAAMEAISKDLQPRVEAINDVVSEMVDSIIRNPSALLWLSQLKATDNYAYGHALDTAVYMLAFGRHLGYPQEDLHKLGFAGLMLDIGKMKLPENLLKHSGSYSPGEFSMMKTHVWHSLDILNQIKEVPLDVYDMVARHHERIDGSGYPAGLKGESIGLFSCMAGIVDCYTALTSDRNHAETKNNHSALQLLYKWSDKYFHQALVEQFAQCIGIFPVGTLVELSSGDIGIVAGQNRSRRLKPKVLLILGPDKQPHARPNLLDLMINPAMNAGQEICIRREWPQGSFNIDPKEYFLG
ncbi:HD-GYP domain-containing protein [Iodobacter sp. HSC-16F04]|uniref:HD-GYP domain-containing protein n=1 Tax=Iodobacter violaceini TaxID=3044271 RepID=A0ABX0KVN1_9NEIS|nr:HD-GYP domain-containing protein [Iodobacter violacea]NHQ85111.1 HD-GYP domain-containing protein [Iodobacter violacea]